MSEISSFFCSQNENAPTPSPSARARDRLSANGANHSQRPISKRRCSRASSASSCGICLEAVSEQGTLLRRLPRGMLVQSCAHEYCFTCVLTWAERTNTCPMCKERFNAVRRMPSKRLRGVGETIEVEYKDPDADSVSDDEDVAAALALSQGEQGSETESSEDSLEGGEEGRGRGGEGRRTAHGYELDDFLVSEGTSEDEEEEQWSEEEEDEEEWQQRSEDEMSVADTPTSVRERPRVQTRALARGGARRTRSEAVSSDGDRRRERTRNRGRVLVRRDTAVVGTARNEESRRLERGNSNRMGSRGTEHVIGSDELRQLQLEAARLLGDSPLRPRRRPPPPSRLPARPVRFRSATPADTSSRNFGVSSRYVDGGNSSGDEPGTGTGGDRGRATGGAGSLNREEGRGEVVTSFEDARSTSQTTADEGRGSSVASSSSESDAGGGLKRAHDGGMIEKEGEEEEHQQEEIIETGISVRDRLAAREVVGGRRRSSPSTAVTLRSASSHQAVQSCGDDGTSERKPPTVARLPRGPSVNEREAPSLAQSRRSVAEPSWSPWLSARRGSSNGGQPLRRSSARASSSAQGGLRAISVRGGGASRNITAAQGAPSAAVAAKRTIISIAGGRRSGRSMRSLPLHETEKENEKNDWGARGHLSRAHRSRRGRNGGGSSHPHQAQIEEEKEEEEEFEWQVGDVPSVAQGGGSQNGRGHHKEERERCRERRSTRASTLGVEGFDSNEEGSGGIYSRGRGASRAPPRPSFSAFSSLGRQDEGLRARLLRRREADPTRLRSHSLRSYEDGGDSFGSIDRSDGSGGGAKGCHEWPKRSTDNMEHRSMSDSDVSDGADEVNDEEAAVGKGRVEVKRTPLSRGRRERGRASGGDRSRGGTSSGTSTQGTIEGFLDQFRFNGPSV